MPHHNDKNHETLNADRLFECSERVLDAVCQLAAANAGRFVPPAPLMGTELEPEPLWEYSRAEVAEAATFLTRMGYLPPE